MNPAPGRIRRGSLLAGAAAVLFTVTTAFLLRGPGDASHWIADGAAYRFQAKTLALGQITVPAPPDPWAFKIPLTLVHEGRWFGQYYPGFPVLLAAGEATGLGWLVNPWLGGLLVFATFLLGRRLVGARAGWIGAVIVAASPITLRLATCYLSHLACAALLTFAGWALARALAARRPGWAALSGFLFGWGVATRPFTGVLLGSVFGIVLLVHLVRHRRAALPVFGAFAGAAALWAAVLLAWNTAMTGDPLLSAYKVLRPDIRIGFGPIRPHGRLMPGPPIEAYTLAVAWVTAKRQLASLADLLFGVGPAGLLLLGAGILAAGKRGLRAVPLVAAPIALMTGYLFYSGTLGVSSIAAGPRYYSEALPAFALVAALPLAALSRRGRAGLAATALALAVVVAPVFRTVPEQAARLVSLHDSKTTGPNRELERALAASADGRDRVVFIDISTYDRAGAMLVNRPDLGGGTVVATYREPAENRAILDAFPGHGGWLARWQQGEGIVLQPYVPEEDLEGPPDSGFYGRLKARAEKRAREEAGSEVP